jgi:hypothetical protein
MSASLPHWPQPQDDHHHHVGVGAHAVLPGDTTVIAAANDLLAYFDNNPCSQVSIAPASAFQSAYNASGLPGALTVDGKYGGNTQAALQAVINSVEVSMGPTQTAPLNCFGMAVPAVPAPNPAPAPAATTTTTTTSTATTSSSSISPVVIGAAAVAVVGGVGYAVYRARRRQRG